MRVLVRAGSVKECEKRVKEKEKRGWKALSSIKIDDAVYDDINYVCVMEFEDKHPYNKNNKWNRGLPYMK